MSKDKKLEEEFYDKWTNKKMISTGDPEIYADYTHAPYVLWKWIEAKLDEARREERHNLAKEINDLGEVNVVLTVEGKLDRIEYGIGF